MDTVHCCYWCTSKPVRHCWLLIPVFNRIATHHSLTDQCSVTWCQFSNCLIARQTRRNHWWRTHLCQIVHSFWLPFYNADIFLNSDFQGCFAILVMFSGLCLNLLDKTSTTPRFGQANDGGAVWTWDQTWFVRGSLEWEGETKSRSCVKTHHCQWQQDPSLSGLQHGHIWRLHTAYF